MTEQPQPNRRARRTATPENSTPPASAPAPTTPTTLANAATILPDIRVLQDERYESLPPQAQAYAVEQDRTLPMWSICHRYAVARDNPRYDAIIEPADWLRDMVQVQSLYVHSNMRLIDISEMSGIALRTLEHASSRYAWSESRRTWRLLRDTEIRNATQQISTLEEAARNNAIRAVLTDAGMDLLRHAQAALARSADKIEPRDIPAMAQVALKLMGAGAKLPTDYKHSIVDNPSANPQTPTVNVLNITTPADAERVLNELSERAARLALIASPADKAEPIS